MSEKPADQNPETGDANSKPPKAPALQADPSPEDANTTPKSTPQQSI